VLPYDALHTDRRKPRYSDLDVGVGHRCTDYARWRLTAHSPGHRCIKKIGTAMDAEAACAKPRKGMVQSIERLPRSVLVDKDS